MTTRIRSGIVGAGYVSEFHIRGLQRMPHVEIAAICDADLARAQATADKLGCAAFASVDEMLAAGLDVVHVATPPHTHAAITTQALEAGCHVFVEKPLATSVEDCRAIAETAKRVNKKVCVCHSLLRDPFVVEALAVVKSGAIGDIMTFDYLRSTEFPPYAGGPLPPQYRAGGYLFRDIGVHALYLMQEFLGPIDTVTTRFDGTGREPNLLYDQWRVVARCKNGTGQAHISTTVRPVQNQFVIQGSQGLLRADMFALSVTTSRQTRLPSAAQRVSNAMGESLQIATQVSKNVLRVVRKDLRSYHGLQDLVVEFYAAILADAPSPVPPEDAIAVVDWVERAAREADEAKDAYLERFPKELSADILVTGATGFIGSHLVKRLLADGKRLRIFVRREPSAAIMADPRIEVVLGDLGDPAAVERAVAGTKLIYHVGAAMSGAGHDFERGTVVGTQNIVDAALAHGVERIVYVSSLSVLHAAEAKSSDRITEEWPLEPTPEQRGFYTQTKLEAERRVIAAVEERGLPAVLLRPGRVFGPGAPLLNPSVGRRVGKRLIVLGDGEVPLPLIYVDDLVDAMTAAAERSAVVGRVFNLVDPEMVTQNELAELCISDDEKLQRLVHVPRAAVNAMAAGATFATGLLGRKSPVTPYAVSSALAPLVFDCSAAAEALGWHPRVGTREGLRRTRAAEGDADGAGLPAPALVAGHTLSLMYHDVVAPADADASGFEGAAAGGYKLSPEQFEAHLDVIARGPVAPTVVTQVTSTNGTPPLLLTFDDGGSSAHSEIAGRLEARGWRGHFFVVGSRIGTPGFVDGEQIRDLVARGHVIGSHSQTHPLRMAALSYDELVAEWRESVAALAAFMPERPTVASIPGGAYSTEVARAAAAAGIRVLFTSEPRTDVQDVHGSRVVGRFTVQPTHQADWIETVVRGDRLPQLKQRALWEAKKVAKRFGGELYLRARESILER